MLKKSIDLLIENDECELKYRPHYKSENIPMEIYYKKIDAMKKLTERVKPYIEGSKESSFTNWFTFYIDYEKITFGSNYFDFKVRLNDEAKIKSLLSILEDSKEMLINALYQVNDIIYILDYRKISYLYPKQNIKCSLCLVNQITKEEDYIVCYLCSTNKKNFYLCSSCTKFVVKENGQTIHEHPLLLVQKGSIQLVKKMSQFKALQFYSPNSNERLNCCSCLRTIDYYYWICGYCD